MSDRQNNARIYGEAVATALQVRQTFGRRFMVVFPDALRTLARDRKSGFTALRVLIWAWENLDWERYALITQDLVAAELCMSAAGVRTGLRRLRAEGILERQGTGTRQQWRITPEASWFGGVKRYRQVVAERAAEPEVKAVLAEGKARRRRAA